MRKGAQLVPVEAVVGVIEVKRTLTKTALTEAVEQLQKIRDSVGISKVDEREGSKRQPPPHDLTRR